MYYNNNRFTAIRLGLPGSAGTRRNIHPPNMYYNKISSAVAEMGGRGHNRRRLKKRWGLLCLFCGRGRSNNVAYAEPYLCTKWHFDPARRLATIERGRKLGALPLFWGGRAESHPAQSGLD